MISPIKVKCKRCGRDYKSDEFVLDPVYKMMVCKECVKERRTQELSAAKTKAREDAKVVQAVQQKEEAKSKPAGWDIEDAEIERAYKQKQAQATPIERVDDERVRYTCQKCKYQFVFNTVKRMPGRCSYCGQAVKYE